MYLDQPELGWTAHRCDSHEARHGLGGLIEDKSVRRHRELHTVVSRRVPAAAQDPTVNSIRRRVVGDSRTDSFSSQHEIPRTSSARRQVVIPSRSQYLRIEQRQSVGPRCLRRSLDNLVSLDSQAASVLPARH